VLTAATLDRSRYPRLVTALDELRERASGPPGTSAEPRPPAAAVDDKSPPSMSPARDELPVPAGEPGAPPEQEDDADVADRVSTRNLLRYWKVALRNRDLQGCRQAFGVLAELSDTQARAGQRRDLGELERQVQHALCRAFRDAIRTDDYAAALTAGEQLGVLFPHSEAARDFTRLEPHLRRRLEARFAGTGS
jgi:hypothetical protein